MAPVQGPPNVIVSTVPASATTTEEHVQDMLFLFSADAGVVVDMAHKPAETPLLILARTEAAGKWHSVMIIAVLLEQRHGQFELWTRRRLPQSVMSKTVLAAYHASRFGQGLIGFSPITRKKNPRNHD